MNNKTNDSDISRLVRDFVAVLDRAAYIMKDNQPDDGVRVDSLYEIRSDVKVGVEFYNTSDGKARMKVSIKDVSKGDGRFSDTLFDVHADDADLLDRFIGAKRK